MTHYSDGEGGGEEGDAAVRRGRDDGQHGAGASFSAKSVPRECTEAEIPPVERLTHHFPCSQCQKVTTAKAHSYRWLSHAVFPSSLSMP